MQRRCKHVAIATMLIIYLLVLLFPPKGYDTYFFATPHYHGRTMPGAEFVFDHTPVAYRSALAAVLSVADAVLLWRGLQVPPAMLIAFPLVGYMWRLEDDQLAFPIIILSYIFWRRRKYVKAITTSALATLLWKGAIVVFGAELLTLLNIPVVTVAMFFLWGVAHINNAIAEQSLLAGILSGLILLPALKFGAKNDVLYLELTALSIGWAKWLWVTLPLAYTYYRKWWKGLPKNVRQIAFAAGIVAALLLAVVEFPSPLATKKYVEECQHPTPQQWGIGWWCQAHGFDYPYAGSPGGFFPSGTSSSIVPTSS